MSWETKMISRHLVSKHSYEVMRIANDIRDEEIAELGLARYDSVHSSLMYELRCWALELLLGWKVSPKEPEYYAIATMLELLDKVDWSLLADENMPDL